MTAAPADLAATLAEALRLLVRGVADRRHGFHLATLATLGLDGVPMARTLVLRGFDQGLRRLRLHSDRRAAKVAELAAEPRCSLHVYDAATRLQLRLSGRAAVHTEDAVAEAGWRGSRAASLVGYATGSAPGTRVPAPPPAPAEPMGDEPKAGEPLDSTAGRDHFCVVSFHFERLESLHLLASGHRRAVFAWDAAGQPGGAWLVP